MRATTLGKLGASGRGHGGPPPRGPDSYIVSNIDFGSSEDARLNRKKWQSPFLSSYSASLSAGGIYPRKGFLTKRSWNVILREAGFRSASPAGYALLTNILDHQVDVAVQALQQLQTKYRTKTFGANARMLDEYASIMKQSGVLSAGEPRPNIIQTPDLWEASHVRPRPVRQMSEGQKQYLQLFKALPAISQKANTYLKKLKKLAGVADAGNPYTALWSNMPAALENVWVMAQRTPLMFWTILKNKGVINETWFKAFQKADTQEDIVQIHNFLMQIAYSIKPLQGDSTPVPGSVFTVLSVGGTRYVLTTREGGVIRTSVEVMGTLGALPTLMSPYDIVFFSMMSAQGVETPQNLLERLARSSQYREGSEQKVVEFIRGSNIDGVNGMTQPLANALGMDQMQ